MGSQTGTDTVAGNRDVETEVVVVVHRSTPSTDAYV